jgi:cold shock CspA family protein
VSAFDETARVGHVLFDDGAEAAFPATALRGSGLLRLRRGQRVRLDTVEEHETTSIVAVQILTLR